MQGTDVTFCVERPDSLYFYAVPIEHFEPIDVVTGKVLRTAYPHGWARA
jgi:hypothetical protein